VKAMPCPYSEKCNNVKIKGEIEEMVDFLFFPKAIIQNWLYPFA